uniref:Putative secreted protein n=1 Tax=Ixodes ricinus TaxID=34613 RepID=A0A6B0UA22_IXORI
MRARALPLAFAIIHPFFLQLFVFFFTTALPLCKRCSYHRRNRIAGKAAGGLASSVPAMGVGYRKTLLFATPATYRGRHYRANMAVESRSCRAMCHLNAQRWCISERE